jgi:hypothetical protein
MVFVSVLNKYLRKGGIRGFQVALEISWVLNTENLKGKIKPHLPSAREAKEIDFIPCTQSLQIQ